MGKPLVSVIVPTYNRLEWLPAAIRSIQEQTFGDWELLLIDDGSTDATEQWALRLNEPRLRYMRRDHEGSIPVIRNAAIRASRGDWIAFLDSDDCWMPDKLSRQIARIQETGASWCYTKYQMISNAGVVVPQPHGRPWKAFEGSFVDRILTTEAAVLVQTLVVAAGLVRELMFDERLPLAEDYDFVLRLASLTPGCVVDDVMAQIRMHDGRTTSLSGPFDGYFGKIIAYRKAARTLGDPELRKLANRQLRSHLAEFLRRAVRHRSARQIARVAVALRRA
jgi:glycosyltransferase involved in cell wall biosynthesis